MVSVNLNHTGQVRNAKAHLKAIKAVESHQTAGHNIAIVAHIQAKATVHNQTAFVNQGNCVVKDNIVSNADLRQGKR